MFQTRKRSISDKLRAKVSGDKNRFNDGEFDLDLTYITDRIIAMSFPAEGMESTYRNSIIEVSNMLDTYHPHHYYIYNLSQREYDIEIFHKRVKSIGWEDHTAPPIHVLWDICISIDQYLSKHEENVVVVHCLAGKGRTGSIIAAYFLFCRLFANAEAAMLYFAYKRSSNNWGVAVPSQRRYVQYMERILEKRINQNQDVLYLDAIELSCIPFFDKTGCNLSIEIVNLTNPDSPMRLFSANNIIKAGSRKRHQIEIQHYLEGDIQVIIEHCGSLSRKSTVAKFQIHTMMIDNMRMSFNKAALDDSFKDYRLPDNFEVVLIFQDVDTTCDDYLTYKKFAKRFTPNVDFSITSSKPDGSLPFFYENENELKEKIIECQITDGKVSTEMGGWLEKQGDTLKLWENRWVSLKFDSLCYFKDPKHVVPKGVISLREIYNIVRVNDLVFELHTPSRVHRFKSHDANDSIQWTEAIEYSRIIMFLNEQNAQNNNNHNHPPPFIPLNNIDFTNGNINNNNVSFAESVEDDKEDDRLGSWVLL